VALLATWMLMGLWHGAAWTFVLWGLWHAMLLLVYRAWNAVSSRYASLRRLREHALWGGRGGTAITLVAVMASWIFFRASNVRQAFTMLGTLLKPKAYLFLTYKENFYLLTFLYALGFFAAYVLREGLKDERLAWVRTHVEWIPRAVVYTILVVLVVSYMRGQQQFIYFQF